MPYSNATFTIGNDLFVSAGFYTLPDLREFALGFETCKIDLVADCDRVRTQLQELMDNKRRPVAIDSRIPNVWCTPAGTGTIPNTIIEIFNLLGQRDTANTSKANNSTAGGRGGQEQDQSWAGWNDSRHRLGKLKSDFRRMVLYQANYRGQTAWEAHLGLTWT